jgi:hypothetical protein
MKTAVEFLIDMLVTENEITLKGENFKLFDQAKEMEKEQIRDAFNAGDLDSDTYFIPFLKESDESEQYYNKTYKSE